MLHRAVAPAAFENLEARQLLSLTPNGTEILVNTTTINNQSNPSVAVDANGDFVVAWVGNSQDGDDGDGVFAQRFNAAGAVQDGEIHVNTYTTGDQNQVSVAMDSTTGGFVVVWTSQDQDGDGNGVFGQRFDASGVAQGAEFQVNSTTTGDQSEAHVAMDASGRFAVTWTSADADGLGVYERQFDSAGATAGGDVQVNEITTGDQHTPVIAMDGAGDFVVAWHSDNYGIYARQFAANGTPQSEFKVDSGTSNYSQPTVAMSADGGFVVAYEAVSSGFDIDFVRFTSDGTPLDAQEITANQSEADPSAAPVIAIDSDQQGFTLAWVVASDGSAKGIMAREFNAGGVAFGDEQLANTTTDFEQSAPSIGVGDRDHYVIAWSSAGFDGDGFGVVAQRFKQSLPPSWPLNVQTQINSFTAGNQQSPSIASDANGDIIVTWASDGEDGSGFGIFAQLYDGDGVPKSAAFRVNTFMAGDQAHPSASMDANGNFVITWDSVGEDGDGYGIYARLYNPAGQAVAGEFRVNTVTTGDQALPQVAMDPNGDFVIVWQGPEADPEYLGNLGLAVFAQRYNPAGVAQGGEFQVNTSTTGDQSEASVAMDSSGDFVITWETSYLGDQSDDAVAAQLFDSSGGMIGTEISVNQTTTSPQRDPKVAMDSSDFVVVWTSYSQDLTTSTILSRRYDLSGTPQTDEVRVDLGPAAIAINPVITMDTAGDYTVAWQSYNTSLLTSDVYARRFNNLGAPRSRAILINDASDADQSFPAIACNPDNNDIDVVWADAGQDGDGYGISGLRLIAPPPVFVSGGTPFQVNTYTTGNQITPSVAMDGAGDFVVTWYSYNQPGESGIGVYAQLYNPSGQPQGSEIHVNTITAGNQFVPVVAMNSSEFVIAWATTGQTTGGDTAGIYMRRYTFTSNAGPATEFDTQDVRINTYTTGTQSQPSVAMDPAGDVVVTWRSYNQVSATSKGDIYARRFTFTRASSDFTSTNPPNTNTLASEFIVNTYTTDNQTAPSVSMDSSGNFIVAWSSFNQASFNSSFDVYARRYDSTGASAQAAELQVNQTNAGVQQNVSVAMTPAGQFMVTWETTQDGGGLGIYGRVFDNSADPGTGISTVEFLVNSTTANDQQAPSVGASSTGGFVVAWSSLLQDGDLNGIYAQRYDVNGGIVGGEFQVNGYTTLSQHQAAVAMDTNGDFVVAWHSGGEDGSNYGIFARRFSSLAVGGGGQSDTPEVVKELFVYQNNPQRIEIYFDRGMTIDPGALLLHNDTFNNDPENPNPLYPDITGDDVQITWDPSINKAIFTWSNITHPDDLLHPNGYNGALPDGEYTVTLFAADTIDDFGNPLPADVTFNFYFINGDANHDGQVDGQDLVGMSNHWLQPSGFSYANGDFNYDGTINAVDLGIVALHWGVNLQTLNPAPPPEEAVVLVDDGDSQQSQTDSSNTNTTNNVPAATDNSQTPSASPPVADVPPVTATPVTNPVDPAQTPAPLPPITPDPAPVVLPPPVLAASGPPPVVTSNPMPVVSTSTTTTTSTSTTPAPVVQVTKPAAVVTSKVTTTKTTTTVKPVTVTKTPKKVTTTTTHVKTTKHKPAVKKHKAVPKVEPLLLRAPPPPTHVVKKVNFSNTLIEWLKS